MPIYRYKCLKCDKSLTDLFNVSEVPKCCNNNMARVYDPGNLGNMDKYGRSK